MSWASALVLLSFCAHAVATSPRGQTCPLPVSNRAEFYSTKDTYRPGDTISYSCNPGFLLNDNKSTLQCLSSGKWKPKDPKCKQLKCEKIFIANGEVTFGPRTFNTKATISCFDRYQLRGLRFVTCGANGSWTPALPTCELVTCPPPDVPNSSGPNGYQKYEVGEHITISCEEGFNLVGHSNVTCGANGKWQKLPKCRLPRGKCLPPPNITNAYTEIGNKRYFEPDTPLRFKCSLGYRVARGSSTVYCRNGRWTDLEMICEKKKCGSAGEIENGRYHYTGSSFGDTATASCNKGYVLVGLDVRHCRANGWDGRSPVCEAIECPEPPQVPYADLDFETNGVIKSGHVASYSCRVGKLIGASDIICNEDGTWSDKAPRCEVVTCPKPNVKFGEIVFGERTEYVVGNWVKFKCNSRRLLGPDVITCGSDRSWTPRLPFCAN